jgi:hypothetical protein
MHKFSSFSCVAWVRGIRVAWVLATPLCGVARTHHSSSRQDKVLNIARTPFKEKKLPNFKNCIFFQFMK